MFGKSHDENINSEKRTFIILFASLQKLVEMPDKFSSQLKNYVPNKS